MKSRSVTIVALVSFFHLAAGPTSLIQAEDVDFDRVISPLLALRCLDCHSGPEPKAAFDLAHRSSAFRGGKSGSPLVPGEPDQSLLWERIAADEMPPKAPLSAREKTLLREWIAAGARWGTDPIDPFAVTTPRRAGRDWWSLQPVNRPGLPVVNRRDWVRSPIDFFILEKLEANHLSPAPQADPRILIRRLSFQLTGLPPRPEEVEAFVQDQSPDAYLHLVDRLLASPEYGVRWARWWLDLARFGESNGYEFDEFRPAAWRYRDWVVEALNRDTPYDQFARLQLAGDVLRPSDARAVAATGFLVAGAFDTVGQNQLSNVMKAVVRSDELEDMVATVGQTFLGLTLNCARCHDHKFDPILQEEYYRVASALSGVRHGERELPATDSHAAELRLRILALKTQLDALEKPARDRIRAAREKPRVAPPEPLMAWTFDSAFDPTQLELDLSLEGAASLTPDGLRLDGQTGYAITAPLKQGLTEKTLEVWVQLGNLDQRGGGAITVQSPDGLIFDSIVFAEREPRRWMSGSENFRRYRSVTGAIETEAVERPIHIAITYAIDGTIRLFRDGVPYGETYKSSPPPSFTAGAVQVVFGQRHLPAGGNRALAGIVMRARLYNRPLSSSEVAASAQSFADHVASAEIMMALPHAERSERGRLLEEIQRLRSSPIARPRAYAVAPREAGAVHIEVRGNPNQPGAVVAAGGVGAVKAPGCDFGLPPDAPEAKRREKLAAWVSGSRNPLFARVVVNRLWQAHFGTGLVENPSDLGFSGGRPSHPELLDWLASEIVERGYSLKAIHRLIVSSAAFRQSSLSNPNAIKLDAGDRLIWRKAPSRLEAEMVRDAMLAVSGVLDAKLGGPSDLDHEIQRAPGTPAILYTAIDPSKLGRNRRSLYRAWIRGGRSGLLDAFDCPDPSTSAPRRAVTTTPLQALSMMNNALVLHLSRAFAARLSREAGPSALRQVDRAYLLALGRAPEPVERSQAIRVVEKAGLAALTRALFNCNEFLYFD
jgi:hypothetical protein